MKAFEIPLTTQLDINRARWVDALRHNQHRQITRMVWYDDCGGVCAAGLALEMAVGRATGSSPDGNQYGSYEGVSTFTWQWVKPEDLPKDGSTVYVRVGTRWGTDIQYEHYEFLAPNQ